MTKETSDPYHLARFYVPECKESSALSFQQVIAGASPARDANARVAQFIERRPPKAKAPGGIPGAGTISDAVEVFVGSNPIRWKIVRLNEAQDQAVIEAKRVQLWAAQRIELEARPIGKIEQQWIKAALKRASSVNFAVSFFRIVKEAVSVYFFDGAQLGHNVASHNRCAMDVYFGVRESALFACEQDRGELGVRAAFSAVVATFDVHALKNRIDRLFFRALIVDTSHRKVIGGYPRGFAPTFIFDGSQVQDYRLHYIDEGSIQGDVPASLAGETVRSGPKPSWAIFYPSICPRSSIRSSASLRN